MMEKRDVTDTGPNQPFRCLDFGNQLAVLLVLAETLSYKILAICQYDVNWDICHYFFSLVLELKTLQNKML